MAASREALLQAIFGPPRQASILDPQDPVQALLQSMPARPAVGLGGAQMTSQGAPGGFDPVMPRDQWLAPDMPTTAGMLGRFQDMVGKAGMLGTSDLALRGGALAGALGKAARKPTKAQIAAQARQAAQAEAAAPFRTAPLEPTPGLPPLEGMPQPPRGAIGGPAAEAAGREAEASGNLLFDYSNLGRNPPTGIPQQALPRPGNGKVSERVQALLDNPQVREQVLGYVRKGTEQGADAWYDIQPIRQEFQKLLGPEEGDRRFRLFVDMIAATSPRSPIDQNVRNASWRYAEALRQGAGVQPSGLLGKTDPNPSPYPYGHFAQKLHAQNAQAVAQGGMDLYRNPKPVSFAENMRGNEVPVTVDAHALTLPGLLSRDPRFLSTSYVSQEGAAPINPRQMVESGQVSMEEATQNPQWWSSAPDQATEYAPLERYWQGIAQNAGLSPRAAQSAAWIGGGEVTGLQSRPQPLQRIIEDRLQLTAKLRGESPRKVLEDFAVRGVPFWSALGLLGVGSALQPGEAEAAPMPPARAAQAPGGALAALLAGYQ